MAKNLHGDLVVASANRLADGAVVYLDQAGRWTTSLQRAAARDRSGGEALLARARGEAHGIVDPLLVAVVRQADGALEPLGLRERIRASGLTFEAIAAEAVRYA
jgi:hypothetical protein